MRSNDAILGTATDFSFFCLLQMQMLKLLKMDKYPELELGSFTHIANSYHVYERHFELIEEMISSDFKPTGFPEIVYDFIRPDGKPTQELDKLIEAVEIKNINYETTDSLYNWIFTKTTR
jgi:thymidylate synthase